MCRIGKVMEGSLIVTPVSAEPSLRPHEKSPAHIEKPEQPRRRDEEGRNQEEGRSGERR